MSRTLFALAWMTVLGCVDYPDGYGAFLDLPAGRRAAAISEYPPEQQVDLYLWDRRVKNPPAPGLADAVARSGDRVLPILVHRIATAKYERDRVDLLYVVLRMQVLTDVDVANDTEIMRALAVSVDAIEDPDWRRQADDILIGIQTGR
jgi:hypothetical protein